ncbi:MAG: amino acid ABC transporter substrate-binding protein [Dehalococcoidia bacterium]|nr:amino acid ABC transporter substrate-binding protein [Dehalococcoidia bacterium]HCV00315.1 amino acid ABC transporter substrate-binding protein [Dehalococcoidia bacterium]
MKTLRYGLLTAMVLAVVAMVAIACGDDESGDSSGEGRGDTIQTIKDRGELKCGVKQTQPLFGFKEADGSVVGFDVEFCKALAAAVLNDASKVEFVDASNAATRFELLASGEIDVLIRTTTITAERDAGRAVDFAQTTFYTGQGFAVHADSAIQSTADMEGATICVQSGTTTEQNLDDHFTELGFDYTPLGGEDAETQDAFLARRCDVWTADQSNLASRISAFDNPSDFRVLGQIISKEPLAPGVRDYDSEWKDVVNWIVHGLIYAEELGVTKANVGQMASNPPNTTIARLLGVAYEGGAVADLGFGVDPQFLQRAIAAVGNYGEIYTQEIGNNIPRACTLNALAIDASVDCPPGKGGILYALPYR